MLGGEDMGGEDMLESNVLLALLDDCGTEEELRHMCERIAPLLADRDERAQLVRRFSMMLKHVVSAHLTLFVPVACVWLMVHAESMHEEASRPLIMAEIQEEDTLCQLGVVEQKDMGGEDMGGIDMLESNVLLALLDEYETGEEQRQNC